MPTVDSRHTFRKCSHVTNLVGNGGTTLPILGGLKSSTSSFAISFAITGTYGSSACPIV